MRAGILREKIKSNVAQAERLYASWTCRCPWSLSLFYSCGCSRSVGFWFGLGLICYSVGSVGAAVGQPGNVAGKTQEKWAEKCLFVCCGEENGAWNHAGEFISGESLRFFVQSTWFLLLVLVEVCALARERGGRVFSPPLLCDWWCAVFVDELMGASLLRLVEGLIHHSPVQVCCRHYSQLTSHSLLPSPSPFTSNLSLTFPHNIQYIQMCIATVALRAQGIAHSSIWRHVDCQNQQHNRGVAGDTKKWRTWQDLFTGVWKCQHCMILYC